MGDERTNDVLSFVVPMWNEEGIIRRCVDAVVDSGEHLVATGIVGGFELVLVDDALTDATGKIADELADEDPRLVAVHHDRNRKLGASVRSGLAASSGDLVLYTDADLPFDLGEVDKAIRLLRVYDADVVSAYRFDRIGEGPRRFAYSYLYNGLVRAALGVRVRDVNFAGKLLRREVVEALDLQSEGSFIDVEILAKAERLGFHVVQFGVDYFPRHDGDSTLSNLAVIGTILKEMAEVAPAIRSLRPLPGRRRNR